MAPTWFAMGHPGSILKFNPVPVHSSPRPPFPGSVNCNIEQRQRIMGIWESTYLSKLKNVPIIVKICGIMLAVLRYKKKMGKIILVFSNNAKFMLAQSIKA